MKFSDVLTFLQGKKTYLIAFAAIIEEVIRYLNKDITGQTCAQEVVGLILAVTIRHGMSTTTANAVDKAVSNLTGQPAVDVSTINIDDIKVNEVAPNKLKISKNTLR